MSNRTLRDIAIVFGLLSAPISHAQLDTLLLPFRALTIEDGLSQGMVNAILQDRYGFMWFATKDGLNRYDGYSFEVFRHDPQDSTSIRDNLINALFEDKQGRFWVGTNEGLDLFDHATERFSHVRFDGSAADRGQVEMITQDRNGNLWVACSKGLVKMMFAEQGTTRNGVPSFTTRAFLDGPTVVFSDQEGMVWGRLRDRMTFRIRPERNAPERLDTFDVQGVLAGSWKHVLGYPACLESLLEDTVRQRRFFIHSAGVLESARGSDALRSVLLIPNATEKECQNLNTIDVLGRVWVATFNGTFLYDPGTNRSYRVHAADADHQLAVNRPKCVYTDRNGVVWVGAGGYGILVYDPRQERFNTVKEPSMNTLRPGSGGTVLISRPGVFLRVFDPHTRSYPIDMPGSIYHHHPVLKAQSNWSSTTIQDGSGAFWFNYAGLFSYRIGDAVPTSHRPWKVVPDRDTANVGAFPLFPDGDSAIWFGSEHALGRYDIRTATYRWYTYPFPLFSSPYDCLHVIHRDRAGAFWLGSPKGLLCVDPATRKWKSYVNDANDPGSLSLNDVFTIAEDPIDPGHVLWVGTNGGGLNRLDMRTGRFTRFGTKEGLPNNVVYGILPDERGNLWMSTNKGIARFDPRTAIFRNYDASDGLQSDEFNRYAFCKQPDGTLFFGGVMGFNYFKAAELADDSTAIAIHITGIKLINRAVDHRDERSPLTVPAYLSEGITIPYSTNMVTFEFATMEFSAPAEHRYQYRLEGFDSDWLMAGNDRSAVYTNLDPGTYTFRVRGDNRDGIWDTRGTSFTLVVLPPWWRTWWAYALYVFALVGSVLLFIRIRTIGLNRQKVMLERTVAERTAELNREKEEADRQRERAEHSGQIKQQFLANMSHEIRTPMNAIMGMTVILRRNAHMPEQDKYLDAIAKSSESLLVIINDVLDLSKMEAGKIVLESVPFDPRVVGQGVQEILRFKAEEKKLYLRMQIDELLPKTLLGDPTRLQQIIMNLVGNAIKFTNEGGISMSMSTAHLEEGKVVLRIDVADTGIGVATDRRERIFEEFDQGQGRTAFKYGGTGLGLSISRRLAQMQGGDITVTSEIGKGSTFTVTIPYAVGKDDVQLVRRSEGLDDHPPLRHLRILLAEDNEFNAMVAQDELADAIPGVQVDVAVNGRIAVEMVQANDYDLILMDVQMPEMNGYDATRAIRALPNGRSGVPILAMTANVMKDEVERCKEAGMVGFVPKPFKREELINAIANALST